MPKTVSGDLKERVARILVEEIEPAMQMTGMQVLDVSDGVVQIRLGGVCASCPSTLMAVIMELEQELKKRIPEIAYLEAVP
jgi:Fe-S cluster biogenesis protein NfuA